VPINSTALEDRFTRKKLRLSLKANSRRTHTSPPNLSLSTTAFIMPYFKITLIRSAIGLPTKTQGVLAALGLRKRMRTVFHPVSPQVAGQIMKVKELVAVSEVEEKSTTQEMREMRKPDPGYYIESAVPR